MQHSPYHRRRTVNGAGWYSRTVDLREILRISRLAPIGKAFRVDGDHERTKYKKLWQAYLDQRSMDLVV
ncbi:hypothetical protein PISMIDRAFT_690949, partial [Pisolithus microcarpus 441]